MSIRPELLAPAGDMESLIAAVENGADAVYFGTDMFSARGFADNFTVNSIMDAIDHAHMYGVKAYVTVNTLIKDSEMDKAINLLYYLNEYGADAVIVQDIGLLSKIRELSLNLPVHASTQMTTHNSEGVKFLEELGVKRVVLAREMSLDDILEIKRNIKNNTNTSIEIETFIHGALCMSYSGQCLFSSIIGGRSGNRGYCAQPCRKKYELRKNGHIVKTDGKYLLSPKDLNTTEILPQLIDAGIDSFKIEGRMKRPEYVAGVVRIYCNLIDRYVEDPSGYFVTKDESMRLAQLFNRGFTSSYLLGTPRTDLMSRKRPYNRGIPIGTVVGYDRKSTRMRVDIFGELNTGDGIGIGDGAVDTGEVVYRMYEDGRTINRAEAGMVVDIPFDTHMRAGSIVYKTLDKTLMESLQKTFRSHVPLRKVPVTIIAKAALGEPFKLEVKDVDLNMVHLESEYVVERATKKPTTKTQIIQQLTKLGNTVFDVFTINASVEDDIFIPISLLNDIRKDAISRLNEARVAQWRRSAHAAYVPTFSLPESECGEAGVPVKPLIAVSIDTLEGVQKAISGGADVIYFSVAYQRNDGNIDYKSVIEYVHKAGRQIYFDTPKIIKDNKMNVIEDIFQMAKTLGSDGVMVSNAATFLHAKKMGLRIIVDSPFNVFNHSSLDFWIGQGARMVMLSPELTLDEIGLIAPLGATECIVHGRLELMESEHCIVGGMYEGVCPMPCKENEFELVDEKRYTFPIKMDSDCRMHVLNSKMLCMLDDIPKIIEAGVSSIRIDARTIDKLDVETIVRSYRDAIDECFGKSGKSIATCKSLPGEYTKGHYFRGVT
ncbi:MAG TPA: peptidase U32 [Methanosarcinaceae archaeon]|nr:peptidase U32 [Methanosarcinaceae archaeon]